MRFAMGAQLKNLNYLINKKELFKEIVFLATSNEYNKAYKIVEETQKGIETYLEYNEEKSKCKILDFFYVLKLYIR